ncbi:MAG: haloacid dehalogenase-like hydrolase [Clostridiales bacterium]|nr:haloacid dehalogenase-like hydrolase [Clostridiales bacterium]
MNIQKKGKEYTNDWPIVAICYDFDKTLSPKDMQEFELIPKLKCRVGTFWKQSNKLAKENGMDRILAYMKIIIDKAQGLGDSVTIRREDFNELGKTLALFPGVDSWFDRINAIAEELNINVEHYIISAGLKEIIQGTVIAKYFTEVYASEFYYNRYGAPCWPGQVVNYTSKTQYLFRISKDCLDLSDEDSINDFIPHQERRIPLQRFIYIGDSETDIPAMKIVKQGGGTSIGVYNPEKCNLDRVKRLLKQERIDFLMPADYSENSRMEAIVKSVLEKIRDDYYLSNYNLKQESFVDELNEVDGFIEYTEDFLSNSDINLDDLKTIQKQAKRIIRRMKKHLEENFREIGGTHEIDVYIQEKEKQLKSLFDKKEKLVLRKNLRISK